MTNTDWNIEAYPSAKIPVKLASKLTSGLPSKMKKRLLVVQLDVFTATPLEGNALAVVLDGNRLSDAEMQAIAKEMNLSETTFILPREQSVEHERGIRVRIFTVAEELPFAGHPTLGTAFVLHSDSQAAEIKLD